jgi:hypothetical protein
MDDIFNCAGHAAVHHHSLREGSKLRPAKQQKADIS